MTSLPKACSDRDHPNSAGDSKVWCPEDGLCSPTPVNADGSFYCPGDLEELVPTPLSADWGEDLEVTVSFRSGVGKQSDIVVISDCSYEMTFVIFHHFKFPP